MIAGLVLLGTLLSTFGALPHLWVFPLHSNLGLWLLFCAVDVAFVRYGTAGLRRLRPLLWGAGILWFTGAQGLPEVGIFLLALPPVLWVAQKRGAKALVPSLLFLLVGLFFGGHSEKLVHLGLPIEHWRFSVHLVAAFLFYRLASWAMAHARGERAPYLATMEYFLAPAFLLSPLHAAYLTRLQPGSVAETVSCGWILRGLAHALAFGLLFSWAAPLLADWYAGGWNSFLGWRFPVAGVLLFAITYLEKSRVSFVAAGFLSLSGWKVEPDFRSPWASASLPEYWRRFHFWVWEFYADVFFTPLSVWLARRVGAAAALRLALFLTFFVGTTVSHYISYPAPFLITAGLGVLFGIVTLLHTFGVEKLPRAVGVGVTWISVWFLYLLAYPAFGLGWGWGEWSKFFGV
jgi:hypothetical protein